jgi:hypothetical protein
MKIESLLPLIGVVIGWVLVSGKDLVTHSIKERSLARKCTFYLLRAWKALLDYERLISFITRQRPDVDAYEPMRDRFAKRFLARIAEDQDSLATGVETLASIDPTAAAQLDNTIKNIRFALEEDFSDIVQGDPEAYVELMNSHNGLIDWTLSDFQMMAEKLASKSGFFQKRNVSAWFQARIDGGQEFKGGIDEFEQKLDERRAKGAAIE